MLTRYQATRYEMAEQKSPADFDLDAAVPSFARKEPPKIDWEPMTDNVGLPGHESLDGSGSASMIHCESDRAGGISRQVSDTGTSLKIADGDTSK